MKRWAIYCAVLAASVVFYSIYIRYLSYYILLVVLATPLFSLLISLPGIIASRITLEPAGSIVRRGDSVCARVKLETRFPLPLSRIKMHYTDANRSISSHAKQKTLSLCGVASGEAEIELDASHCGCIELTVKKLLIYDYLGLFAVSKRPPDSRLIYVYPTPEKPDPMPSLPSGDFFGMSLKPKYGGGFAEEHDLRPYRVGDAMNSIHWKLSSKLDSTIVREPLVRDKGKALICYDLFGTPGQIDSTLGQIEYLAGLFLRRTALFTLCRYESDAEGNSLVMADISDREEYERYIGSLLGLHFATEGVSVADIGIGNREWHYTVRPNTAQREVGQ